MSKRTVVLLVVVFVVLLALASRVGRAEQSPTQRLGTYVLSDGRTFLLEVAKAFKDSPPFQCTIRGEMAWFLPDGTAAHVAVEGHVCWIRPDAWRSELTGAKAHLVFMQKGEEAFILAPKANTHMACPADGDDGDEDDDLIDDVLGGAGLLFRLARAVREAQRVDFAGVALIYPYPPAARSAALTWRLYDQQGRPQEIWIRLPDLLPVRVVAPFEVKVTGEASAGQVAGSLMLSYEYSPLSPDQAPAIELPPNAQRVETIESGPLWQTQSVQSAPSP